MAAAQAVLGLAELLEQILSYLTQPALRQAMKVSSLWHTTALPYRLVKPLSQPPYHQPPSRSPPTAFPPSRLSPVILAVADGDLNFHPALVHCCAWRRLDIYDFSSTRPQKFVANHIRDIAISLPIDGAWGGAGSQFVTEPPMQALGLSRRWDRWVGECCVGLSEADVVVYARGGVRVRDLLDVVQRMRGVDGWVGVGGDECVSLRFGTRVGQGEGRERAPGSLGEITDGV